VAAGILVSAQIDLVAFTPNTPILSEEVNSNFETLASALENLQSLPSVQTLNDLAGDLSLIAGDNVAVGVDETTGEITITSTAQGTAGGDITGVGAGVGLSGGGESGGVTLSVAPAFRLPEGCTADRVAKFDTGTGLWSCGVDADSGTTYSAGTGLSLSSSTLSVTPSFRLPRACSNGSIA